jgi:cytoskeletal protein CcmA (bactofilin family)
MSLLKIRQFSIDQTDTFVFANANVTANLFTGNANLGNLATANFFSGNGNALFNIQGANVVGTVANATLATNVTASAQSNITSVGSLTGLTVSNATGIVDFTTSANVTLGAVANLHITGGTNGQFLKTDGSGVLSWSAVAAGTGNANIAGSNTQIFFNNAGSNTLGTSANLTFDSTTKTLTVDLISADGYKLSNIAGANVVGTVANANNSAYLGGTIASSYLLTTGTGSSLTAITGANVTGTVASANNASYLGGTIASSYLLTTGTGSSLTAITGANVTGTVANANNSAYLGGTVASSYLLTTGTGSSLTAITGANVTGFVPNANVANTAFAVTGSNVSGQVANALIAGTVYTNAQPNITSVGTLTSLDVTGNIASGNANLGNLATANFFSGNGNALFSIQGANVTGTVANANNSAYLGGTVAASYLLTTGTGSSLTAITGANVTGTVSSATVAASANSVTGGNVSGQVGNALIAGTVYTNAQPNITSVGTLSSLSVTGDIGAANLTLTGNLIISGTTTSVNSTVTRVVDPIFELGGGANGAALSSDDNKDRGVLLHYYSGSSAIDAFMGWDDSNGEFGVGSNVSLTGEVVTWNSYGNIRADVYFGNGSQLTGVSAASSFKIANGTSNVNIATVDGNVTVGVSGNAAIVTVTGTGVNIAGYANLGSGNLLTSGNATVGYIIGNGSSLTSITGANVTGTVANANNSAYLGGTIASSYLLTTGTGSSLTAIAGANVTGTVASANNSAYLGGTVAASYLLTTGTGSSLTAITGANVTGTVANATYAVSAGSATTAGTVTTAAQGNITSLGTLSSLAVSGTTNLGAVGNVTITGGSANYYLKTDGAGVLSFASLPSTTMTVDSFTGDGSWTMKTLSVTPASSSYTLVAIGGVFQPRTSYSLSGAVITFSDPPPNGAIVEITTLMGGVSGGGGGSSVSWTYSAVSANTTAVASYRYIVDTSSANITITLPASGTLGDEVMIIDGTGNASTHAITVGRNGGKIAGSASDMTVTTDRAAFTLVYYNSTQGWILTNV